MMDSSGYRVLRVEVVITGQATVICWANITNTHWSIINCLTHSRSKEGDMESTNQVAIVITNSGC